MKINEEIKEALANSGIIPGDGVVALLALYYGYETAGIIPPNMYSRLQIARIVSFDKSGHSFLIPLFEGQETAFAWVKDWVQLFADKNKDRKGSVPNSTSRMKKFFANNPDVRKDEVIRATELYLRNTDAAYIMTSHYFITKGVGADRRDVLLEWVEKIRESEETTDHRGITNRMQ